MFKKRMFLFLVFLLFVSPTNAITDDELEKLLDTLTSKVFWIKMPLWVVCFINGNYQNNIKLKIIEYMERTLSYSIDSAKNVRKVVELTEDQKNLLIKVG